MFLSNSVDMMKNLSLWACVRGDVSTPSFGSHLNPISTRGGGQIIYWCPQQVLKAKGAPDMAPTNINMGPDGDQLYLKKNEIW